MIETVRHAMDSVTAAVPVWLAARAKSEWVERVDRCPDNLRFPDLQEGRHRRAGQVGKDCLPLLVATCNAGAHPPLPEPSDPEALREIRVQQRYRYDGSLRWRTEGDGLPPVPLLITSP